jgi:GAF domain-containing protein
MGSSSHVRPRSSELEDRVVDDNGLRLASDAVSRVLVADSTIEEIFQRVADAVGEALGAGCSVGLAVDVPATGRVHTVACTDERASRLDRAQYDADDGPCLEAFRAGTVVRIDDVTAAAERWPSFIDVVAELDVRSILSVPVVEAGRPFGTFNLYGSEASVFDADVEDAERFAAQASVVLSNARAYSEAVALAMNLQRAMDSRAVIEQAKGKLMASSHISADEAFELMRRASQRENVKLRDIATRIVEGHGTTHGI